MKLRNDIQALRGIAVLLVVIFHARLHLFRAGYLGVDVFFVISGFLITGMVKTQIQERKFSFAGFYFRRAKRLLPAAYTTFLITAVVSHFLLTSVELHDLGRQLIGAITFTANIVLWRQGTYFGGASALKPLLHTWSLSIEEQYYLILPTALLLIPRRLWARAMVAAAILSIAACVALASWKPDAAFYLLPTRGWELAFGSIGALIPLDVAWRRPLQAFFWPALGVLLAIPAFPLGRFHPGIDALLVCLATLIVILRAHPRCFESRAGRALATVGDFSYSLYLVHWPLFAFVANVWVGEPPTSVNALVAVSSIGLAYAQYRFVENPLRNARVAPGRKSVAAVLLASATILGLSVALCHLDGARATYAYDRRGNTGLSSACAFNDAFVAKHECETGVHPTVLLWGDSYAMHLAPGLVATRGSTEFEQATKYVCGPLIGLAPVGTDPDATQNVWWAKGCIRFNQSVLEYVESQPTIDTVILASVFLQYLSPDHYKLFEERPDGTATAEPETNASHLTESLRATVDTLRRYGKRVVVVGPPPSLDYDAGRCSERRALGLLTLGNYRDCVIPVPDYERTRARLREFLARVRQFVPVVDFESALLDRGAFRVMIDGRSAFIANGHFSYDGSVLVARQMNLMTTLLDRAQ